MPKGRQDIDRVSPEPPQKWQFRSLATAALNQLLEKYVSANVVGIGEIIGGYHQLGKHKMVELYERDTNSGDAPHCYARVF